MALDERYIPAYSLINTFLDKDSGAPLAGGTIECYSDPQRVTPKPLFQLTGVPPNYSYVSLPNPLVLNGIGQIQDTSNNPVVPYYFPFDSEGAVENYYLVVKNSSGVEQFTRSAVPGLTPTTDPTAEPSSVKNELINSQFVEVNFNSGEPITYTFSGAVEDVIKFAPGWEIVVTGTGSLTLTRVSIPGSSNIVTNPPFVLDINTSTLTTVFLRQRLLNNPGIWSRGYVSGFLIAESQDAGPHTLNLSYQSSSGAPVQNIVELEAVSGQYTAGKNTVELSSSTNSQTGEDGYVDILLSLPSVGHVRVSSIQVVGLEGEEQNISYDQEPANRQKALFFNEYRNQILIQPKDTILSGWYFPLNPFQFTSRALTPYVGTTPTYIADQTILRTELPNSISVESPTDVSTGLTLRATANPQGRFALIQYIDPAACRGHFCQKLSSAINARLQTASSTNVKFKIKILKRDSLPFTLSPTEPINGWGASDPLFSAGWTIVNPDAGDIEYGLDTNFNTYTFNSFEMPAQTSSDSMFAVVFYTTTPFASVATDFIDIRDISLVHNEFALLSSPKSFEESLADCEGYYETSYESGILPGAVSLPGSHIFPLYILFIGGGYRYFLPCVDVGFHTEKIRVPQVTVYDPYLAAAPNFYAIRREINNNASLSRSFIGDYVLQGISTKRLSWYPSFFGSIISNTPGSIFSSFTAFHYTADARLGIF